MSGRCTDAHMRLAALLLDVPVNFVEKNVELQAENRMFRLKVGLAMLLLRQVRKATKEDATEADVASAMGLLEQALAQDFSEPENFASYRLPGASHPEPVCPDCNGSGLRDSGGTHPWGEPVMLPCDCGSQ